MIDFKPLLDLVSFTPDTDLFFKVNIFIHQEGMKITKSVSFNSFYEVKVNGHYEIWSCNLKDDKEMQHKIFDKCFKGMSLVTSDSSAPLYDDYTRLGVISRHEILERIENADGFYSALRFYMHDFHGVFTEIDKFLTITSKVTSAKPWSFELNCKTNQVIQSLNWHQGAHIPSAQFNTNEHVA